MTTRKPSSTEDWTHLGKLDTSRVLVRAEGAIWNGLAALGVPAGIIKVLKWCVRAGVLLAAAIYSLYLFVPLMLALGYLWLASNASPSGTTEDIDPDAPYGRDALGHPLNSLGTRDEWRL